jgi:hypothetical protein
MASGTSVTGARSTRRKQVHPWRVVIVVGALALVVSLLAFLASNADTSDQGRQAVSADVNQVAPAPGSLARPQDAIEIHLRSGLTGVLVLNGKRLPEDQQVIDNATSTIRFQPREGSEVSRLPAGTNNASVLYWNQTEAEPAKPKSFGWSFRVGA